MLFTMSKRISLRGRIYSILSSLLLITLVGGLVMVWYTYRMERLLTSITEKKLVAFQAAETLETTLVNQKGFVSYYFIDGNIEWLRQLGEYRQIFKERLKDARNLVENENQRNAVNLIESVYISYITDKDQVIAHYIAGEREAGVKLHQKVRGQFLKILSLCEQYKNMHAKNIIQARKESNIQARKLRIIAGGAMLIAFSLAVLLGFVLVNNILEPIRRLTAEVDRKNGVHSSENEIKALSHSVRELIEDAKHTHSELEQSREHLLQSEKMALVGKLAAGMAHSIRNPFTSVKMRLFSLSRSLDLSKTQKDDFEVISEEIRHVDTIVQNFLEFSRPPKLKMQQISPSLVVDMVIQLLKHRLKSYDVKIKVVRKQMLPKIEADPEQLKEVLVNLVVNACESMKKGGVIVIRENEASSKPFDRMAVIRLSDNGPGIPHSILGKVLQPFFTTKEEGSGLGLSIAARIIEEHRGTLDITSKEGEGATFIISLPLKE